MTRGNTGHIFNPFLKVPNSNSPDIATMFSTRGFLKDIPCPVDGECTLIQCFFKHDDVNPSFLPPVVVESTAESQAKKRKTNLSPRNSVSKPEVGLSQPRTSAFFGALVAPEKEASASNSDGNTDNGRHDLEPRGLSQEYKSPFNSAEKPVSPPPVRRSALATARTPTSANGTGPKRPAETLNPRKVTRAPVDHGTRLLYLKKLHEGMARLNEQAKTSSNEAVKAIGLDDAQLITLALDEEEKIATENTSIYANIIKLRMVAYKKMSLEEWKLARLEDIAKHESLMANANKTKIQSERGIETGLTAFQERQILPHILEKQHGLEQFGYVTSPPSANEIAKAEAGVSSGANWEMCERCSTRFQVFPDRRREDGAISTGGECTYHHGRLLFPPKGHTTGHQAIHQKIHSCCSQPIGTFGCTTAPTHVFKVYDSKRLASIMQYERTPDNPSIHPSKAIAFDCELAFTVHGMEIVRLTAVSWPKGETVLDVLVTPLGRLLDLNSRYSGVHANEYFNAPPYQDKDENIQISNDTTESKDKTQTLCKVDSPYTARKLFFKLLTPSTPLIGHAIENDLNAIRVVHPCIIDTVVQFPHERGPLPLRKSLKSLASHYMWRDIQVDSSNGHDSAEDAKASGDLIRVKVKRKWKEMQRLGWRIDADGMVRPPVKSLAVVGAPTGPRKQIEEENKKREHEEGMKRAVEESKKQKQAFEESKKRTFEEMNSMELDYD